MIYRPLIKVYKKDLYKYAHDFSIPFREDSTNSSNFYSRNFIRNKVLPLIESRFNGFKSQLVLKLNMFYEFDNYVKFQASNFISEQIIKTDFGFKILKKDLRNFPSFLQFEILKQLGVLFSSYKNFLDFDSKISSSGFLEKFNSKLDDLNLFYFKSLNIDGTKMQKNLKDIKFKGRSINKSKQVKSIPFYFRGGIPVAPDGEFFIK